MRITKIDSDTRQAFVAELLTDNPKMTIREVNEKVKEKFGKAMRPPLIQAVRARVAGGPVEAPPIPVPANEVVTLETVLTGSLAAPAPVTDTLSTVGAVAPAQVEPLTTTTEVPSTTVGQLLTQA